MTTQIGFLLIAFYKQLVRLGIQLPINMLSRFARIVLTVLCEFHRKTMQRALVQTRNKTRNNLFGNQFKIIILGKLGIINRISHLPNF